MRLLAIEQTRSPQGKLRLRFDSGEAMLVLPAVVADLSLRPGMDIPDAARASLEAAAGSASAKERAVRILSAATVSRAELEHRLRSRGDTSEEQIKMRLERASWEMEQRSWYDYTVVNDDAKRCAEEILTIIANLAD